MRPPRASGRIDAEERARRPGAERARRGGEVRVGRLERGDRLPDVERARDVRDGDVTAAWVNGSEIPSASKLDPSRPSRPNAASSPIPATAGGRTSGSSTSVTASARPRKRPAREQEGEPASRTARSAPARSRVVLMLTTNASRTTGFESWSTRCAGEVRAKIATIGSSRNASATQRRVRRRAPSARTTRLRLDARQEAGRDQLLLRRLARAALDERLRVGLVPARRDDADAVPHLRLRPRRHLDRPHLSRNRRRVGRIDEARVGLAERDLREHLAHVGLLADDVPLHGGGRFSFLRTCSV